MLCVPNPINLPTRVYWRRALTEWHNNGMQCEATNIYTVNASTGIIDYKDGGSVLNFSNCHCRAWNLNFMHEIIMHKMKFSCIKMDTFCKRF